MVHDIGYPLSFLLKSNKNVSRYVPNSISFIKEINNIEYLDSKLKDTLLLKVVGIKEIVKGLEKYDHGVLSAIILLLFYYDNGKIYSLSKTEKAIIELSSLIIYNHTIKYKNQEEKRAEYDYVKNIFVKNPLSYIFRLCDDIQEWDRVYFENTRESNYTICNNCKTPLVRKHSNCNLKEDSNKELKKIEYSCMCNSENTYNLRANEYRKTINVICCKEVDINYKELNNNSESGIPRNKEIVFKYDLFSLLEVAKYNVGYADIRAKEIKKIKIALSEQNDLYNTYVDFFMSNNPVELKLEILRRYLKKNTGIKNCQELLGSLPFNNNGSVLVKKINEIIKKRFEIYYNLVDLINKIDSNKKEEFLKKIDKIIEEIANTDFKNLAKIASEKYYNANQCTREKIFASLNYDSLEEYNKLKQIYLNLYQCSNKEKILINNYFDRQSYLDFQSEVQTCFNSQGNSNDIIDNWNHYLDVYYFYFMNEETIKD